MNNSPLAGLKVIELSTGVAGPYTGKLFADMGAEVIKVEPRKTGDDARKLAPYIPGAKEPENSAIFAYLNTNKKSITLDLENSKAIKLLKTLVASADVLTETFAPGRLDSLGLSPEELHEINPGLVIVSITWFGQTGPYKNYKGRDAIVHALTGLTSNIGPVEGPPVTPSGYQAQFIGGLTAFSPCMGALIGAKNGFNKQHIDVSIFEANLCFNETGAVSFVQTGEVYGRQGINRFIPTYPASVFPCKDGWIGANVLTPAQWLAMCELIDEPELAAIEEYSTSLYRIEQAEVLEPILAKKFITRTADEWFHEAQKARIPFALVPTMADLLASPHFNDRQSFVDIIPPSGRTFKGPAAPFKLKKSPSMKGGASPSLGRHNLEIFKTRLGLSDREYGQLEKQGVI